MEQVIFYLALVLLLFWACSLPSGQVKKDDKNLKKDAEKTLIQMQADSEKKRADMDMLTKLLDRGHFDE